VFTFREVADGILFALTLTLQGHATPTRVAKGLLYLRQAGKLTSELWIAMLITLGIEA
jgi:hypothetical protein